MAHVPLCEHIKDNGITCGSPALTGAAFCFFHQRLRQPRHRPGDFEYRLPVLDSPHAVLMAVQHISQAALDGVLEERRARTVLASLRLAMATLKEINKDAGAPSLPVVGKGGMRNDDTTTEPSGTNANVDAGAPSLPVVGKGGMRNDDTTTEPSVTNANVDTGAPSFPVVGKGGMTKGGTIPESPRKDQTLTPAQLAHARAIIRRGPRHPEFAKCARQLDAQISRGKSA